MRGTPRDPSTSPQRAAWTRFRRNRQASVGAIVLSAIALLSLLTLPFSLRWYNVQSLDVAVRHGPSFKPVVRQAEFVETETTSNSQEAPPLLTRLAHVASSWAGHDDLGRSLIYRLLLAFLISAGIGAAAALTAVVIGVLWGAMAGLIGGHVDVVMMRIVDVLYGLPYILMVILMKIAFTRPLVDLFGGHTGIANIVVMFLAIGSVSWLTMARMIRGQVLSLRAQGFVEAARAAGARPLHILRWHIIPNVIGPVVVYATLTVPQAILQESFLSFLGIGVQQPIPSLGHLAAEGIQAVNAFVGFWWLIAFPCGLLVVTILALNFIGDGLRDALDPKSSAAMLV